jgi:hypothetical protein
MVLTLTYGMSLISKVSKECIQGFPSHVCFYGVGFFILYFFFSVGYAFQGTHGRGVWTERNRPGFNSLPDRTTWGKVLGQGAHSARSFRLPFYDGRYEATQQG